MMGLRFNKRIKIIPGVTLNIGKNGVSTSIGVPGMSYNIGKNGTRTTLSVPGTGISYVHHTPKGKQITPRSASTTQPIQQPVVQDIFEGLGGIFAPEEEKRLVSALRYLLEEQYEAALGQLQGIRTTSASYLRGFCYLIAEDYVRAESELRPLLGMIEVSHRYILDRTPLELMITDYTSTPLYGDNRGIHLMFVEILQEQNKIKECIEVIKPLWQSNPADLTILLSLLELVANHAIVEQDLLHQLIEATATITNDSPLQAEILLMRIVVLYQLGLTEVALKEASALLRKKKDRALGLLHEIRYVRGQLYEELGNTAKAKEDYSVIYSENPSFEGIKEKLFQN